MVYKNRYTQIYANIRNKKVSKIVTKLNEILVKIHAKSKRDKS